MIRTPVLLALLALAACGQPAVNEDNVALTSNAAEQVPDRCRQPELALADGSPINSSLLNEAKANFAAAFENACAKNLFEKKPLFDPGAAEQDKLFLINAPEANVASIYLSEIDGNRMVLEYPFLTTDGKSQVPSVQELEEAIHCLAVGATPEEQESSGRCLVD